MNQNIGNNSDNDRFLLKRMKRRDFLYLSLGAFGFTLASCTNMDFKNNNLKQNEIVNKNNFEKILFNGGEESLAFKVVAVAEGNLVKRKNDRGDLSFESKPWAFGHADLGNLACNIGNLSLQIKDLVHILDQLKAEVDRSNIDASDAQIQLLQENRDRILQVSALAGTIYDKYQNLKTDKERATAMNAEYQKDEFKQVVTPLIKIANAYQLESLKQICYTILSRAEKQGLKLNTFQMLNILDVYNQSKQAVLNSKGLIDLLAELNDGYKTEQTPTSAMLLARTLAFVFKDGVWGGFTDYINFTRDQRRRFLEIYDTMLYSGFEVLPSNKPFESMKSLDRDSNLTFDNVSSIDKVDPSQAQNNGLEVATRTRFEPLSKDTQSGNSSAIYAHLPSKVVKVEQDRVILQITIPDDFPYSIRIYNKKYLHYVFPDGFKLNDFRVGQSFRAGQIIADLGSFPSKQVAKLGITDKPISSDDNRDYQDNQIATRNLSISYTLVDKNGISWLVLPMQDCLISEKGQSKILSEVLDINPEFAIGIKEYIRNKETE